MHTLKMSRYTEQVKISFSAFCTNCSMAFSESAFLFVCLNASWS